MEKLLVKYGSVYLVSSMKYMMGPLTGASLGLSIWETALFTFLGMMSSVILFTFIGIKFRHKITEKLKKKGKYKLFTKKNRRIVKIWQKFGITGVAFLTPPVLTPIAGTIIALSFRVPRKKLWLYMAISAALWSFPVAFFFNQLENGLEKLF